MKTLTAVDDTHILPKRITNTRACLLELGGKYLLASRTPIDIGQTEAGLRLMEVFLNSKQSAENTNDIQLRTYIKIKIHCPKVGASCLVDNVVCGLSNVGLYVIVSNSTINIKAEHTICSFVSTKLPCSRIFKSAKTSLNSENPCSWASRRLSAESEYTAVNMYNCVKRSEQDNVPSAVPIWVKLSKLNNSTRTSTNSWLLTVTKA